ncbi:response regulator transcription factor [Dinghuibacter silviterrae]|nr:response regulator transcription factor [Dinghuibacter silviterrae]
MMERNQDHTSESRMIKVVIADDHVLYRAGVKTALAAKPDVRIVAEADNGVQLVHMLKYQKPDVVLLDIQMPLMDGIGALQEIKRDFPDVKVVVLSMHDDNSMITRMMELGANGYLTKTADLEAIYEAIRNCYYNEFHFNATTNMALIDNLRNKKQAIQDGANPEAKLSEKEITVLKLMCEERSTREIADMVDASPRTIEAIRDRIKAKLNIKTTAGLILYAVKHNLLEG